MLFLLKGYKYLIKIAIAVIFIIKSIFFILTFYFLKQKQKIKYIYILLLYIIGHLLEIDEDEISLFLKQQIK